MWAADAHWTHAVAVAARADYLAAKYDEPQLYKKAALLWAVADELLSIAVEAANCLSLSLV